MVDNALTRSAESLAGLDSKARLSHLLLLRRLLTPAPGQTRDWAAIRRIHFTLLHSLHANACTYNLPSLNRILSFLVNPLAWPDIFSPNNRVCIIYTLFSTVTPNFYVGRTFRPLGRFCDHFRNCFLPSHLCTDDDPHLCRLYKSMSRTGPETWLMGILSVDGTIPPTNEYSFQLGKLENAWIKFLSPSLNVIKPNSFAATTRFRTLSRTTLPSSPRAIRNTAWARKRRKPQTHKHSFTLFTKSMHSASLTRPATQFMRCTHEHFQLSYDLLDIFETSPRRPINNFVIWRKGMFTLSPINKLRMKFGRSKIIFQDKSTNLTTALDALKHQAEGNFKIIEVVPTSISMGHAIALIIKMTF